METSIFWKKLRFNDVERIYIADEKTKSDEGLAVLDLIEDDRIDDLCKDIEEFIKYHDDYSYQIKNDDDQLGIIVDIWDTYFGNDELIDTATFWFEDYLVGLE